MTALGAPLRLALLVTGLCAIAPQVANAAAPESCPDRSDPDVDYLCPVGPSLVIPGLTDLGGWDEESHYSNILYGDIDGDGADEMVARGTAGIEVYEFKQTPGQWSQVAVAPVLPDREGWDQPRYHRTIQLGDIDGDGKDELVARSRDGMIVLRFVPGRRPGSGSWTLVTTSGPFSDRDAWGSGPRYYSTIKLSPIGRRFDEQRPTMQLIGRGSDGLLVYRWTGNGWQLIARLGALSDQAGWDEPEYYRTIMAWDRKYLVARGPKGLAVYELLQLSASPTDTDWRTLRERGPCQIKPDDQSYPCDTDTIQLVHGLRGVRTPAWPVVLARDPSGVGLRLAVFDLGQRQWLYATPGRSPWWPNEYDRDQYAETIQAADIDGDGYVEVIGRSEPGTLTMDLEIDSRQNVRWTKKSNSFDPSLVSDSWARAEYFRTITTAKLDPDSASRSLLARGRHGIRTWRFKQGAASWARYRPYGDYPDVDTDALDALSAFLSITRGTVRDIYSEPGRDPSVDRLQGLQASIAARCSGQKSANPDQYESCMPPPRAEGISAATWTEVSNQIIAELYWARRVIDHFTALDNIQSRLFLDQSSQFPSMVADLKLASAGGVVARVDYQQLFLTILGVLASTPIPGVSQVAGAVTGWLSIVAAGAPVVTGEEPSEFEHTYAEVQRKLATVQQEIRDAITAQRRYVLGDYGLVATVGRLVASGTWELDGQAALSAGRQAFTRSMYEAFLPALWDRWDVTGCLDLPWPSSDCELPGQGPLLVHTTGQFWYGKTTLAFHGLVPRQSPCTTDVIRKYGRCSWLSLDQGFGPTLSVLLGPVGAACRYDPRAGTSWRYGCALGVPAQALMEPGENSPWARFRTIRCDMRRIGKPEHCLQRQPGG